MRSSLLFFLLLAGLAGASPARATSVIPPSFPELVAEAEAIYRGRVSRVEARRVEHSDGGSVIKTFVTFAVERVLKGPGQTEVTLEFLGGTVGDETLTVTGMPVFAMGDREIVFVQKNGMQLCPLVALMHGRYRVKRDESGAREYVARDNGMPLTNVAEVELPMVALPGQVRTARAAITPADALSSAEFETSVVDEVKRRSARPQQN
jgi:hypothetical protein